MRKNKILRNKLSTKHLALFNVHTGELIDLMQDQIELVRKTDTKYSIVSSTNYVYLDTDSIRKLCSTYKGNLNKLKLDLGLLFLLSPFINYKTNALLKNDGVPFTASTIAEELLLKQRTVKDSLNSLIEIGAISHCKLDFCLSKTKHYCVNPRLVRKGKEFYNELFIKFGDLQAYPSTNELKNFNKDLN